MREFVSGKVVALAREFAAAGKLMKAGDPKGWRAWREHIFLWP